MGLEVCLERCDSYGHFGYLKKSKKIILREFCKRLHCPAIGTLTLLLFIQWCNAMVHLASSNSF